MLTLSGAMGSKAFFTTITIALTAAFATGASAMDISLGSNVRLSAGYLSLNHDASHLTPPGSSGMASYGDPTSILSYEPLYQADIEFSLTGRGEEGWFDLIAAFPIAAGGTFGDRDYEAGQALYSETFSDITLENGGSVSLRYGLPTDGTLVWNDMVVAPLSDGRVWAGALWHGRIALRCRLSQRSDCIQRHGDRARSVFGFGRAGRVAGK